MPVKFGDAVIDMGFISQAQLNEAIEHQLKGRAQLGKVMLNLRLLTPEQVQTTIEFQNSSIGNTLKFGDCALKLNLVSPEGRDKAVRYQITSKGMLGEILIELGYLTVNQRDEVVQKQIKS